MADFNKDYLLGDLVPRTFINKVTLETKNKPVSKNDNPHILENEASPSDFIEAQMLFLTLGTLKMITSGVRPATPPKPLF